MMNPFQKKSTRYLLSVIIVYALLVAPHEGEFWPFSIYPMFSQAGNLWTRALVRDVTLTPDSLKWQTTNFDKLTGSPIALQNYGIDAIDFANFVSKTKDWDLKRRRALQKMFGAKQVENRKLMIMKVSGKLVKQDSIVVNATPLMLLTTDTVLTGHDSVPLKGNNFATND